MISEKLIKAAIQDKRNAKWRLELRHAKLTNVKDMGEIAQLIHDLNKEITMLEWVLDDSPNEYGGIIR